MFFRDLCVCNKDWDDKTKLNIVLKTDSDAFFLTVMSACSMYGDRKVLWFRDCVVMLL